MNLKVGETKRLYIEFEPSTAFDCFISAYSSDPEVATISETDIVTAKKEGTATIVVTAEGWGGRFYMLSCYSWKWRKCCIANTDN